MSGILIYRKPTDSLAGFVSELRRAMARLLPYRPKGAALKRCYSLKKNRDFQFTYRMGKSVGSRLCTLIYVRDRRKPRPSRREEPLCVNSVRVGFSVSKKLGNSVIRNRAKRRLREAFSPLLPLIKPGHNLIVIARSPVLDEPFVDLRHGLRSLLKKADLLMPPPEAAAEEQPVQPEQTPLPDTP